MTDNRSVECTFKSKTMLYYSIVIPHKNAQDLLKYCLDSIPIRDDIQVIVVDDNSDADKETKALNMLKGSGCFLWMQTTICCLLPIVFLMRRNTLKQTLFFLGQRL